MLPSTQPPPWNPAARAADPPQGSAGRCGRARRPPGPREDDGDARVLDEGEPARRRLERRRQIAVDDAAVDDNRNRLAAVLRRDLADRAGDARPQRVVSLGAGHEVPAPGAGEHEPLGVARLRAAAELTAFPVTQPHLAQILPLLY